MLSNCENFTKSKASYNNWYWPTSEEEKEEYKRLALIKQILQEEEARQLLSTEHLEETLRSNLGNESKSENAIIVSPTASCNDDYWAEGNDCMGDVSMMPTLDHSSLPAMQEQQQLYWYWPTLTPEEEKQRVIDTILQEERCREFLSVEHVEETISRQRIVLSSQESSVEPESNGGTESSDMPYWDWLSESHPFVESSLYWDEIASDDDEEEADAEEVSAVKELAEKRQRLYKARNLQPSWQCESVFKKEVTDMTAVTARATARCA